MFIPLLYFYPTITDSRISVDEKKPLIEFDFMSHYSSAFPPPDPKVNKLSLKSHFKVILFRYTDLI